MRKKSKKSNKQKKNNCALNHPTCCEALVIIYGVISFGPFVLLLMQLNITPQFAEIKPVSA